MSIDRFLDLIREEHPEITRADVERLIAKQREQLPGLTDMIDALEYLSEKKGQ